MLIRNMPLRKFRRNNLIAPKFSYPFTEITNELNFTPTFFQIISEKLGQKEPNTFLRLDIFAGEGCEGFTYKFNFDSEINQKEDYVKKITQITDKQQAKDKIVFAVNGQNINLLKGATIDYAQEMMREVFYVKENPNAEIQCSCKTSFSPKAGLF